MKKLILLPLFALLISCGGMSSKYEKLIADVVQTNSRGTKYDLSFKTEKLEEIQRISVADSIKILTDAFNADKDKKLSQLEQSLKRNTEGLAKEKNSRYSGKTMIAFYQSNIDRYSSLIDSVKASVPTETARYENLGGEDILAVVVRCTYSIDEPVTKIRATETFDFYLSPDATKYYSKKRVKE